MGSAPPLQRPVKSDDQILQEELQKLEVQESEVKSADTRDKFCRVLKFLGGKMVVPT